MTEDTVHQSVLVDEVLAYLNPKTGGISLDGTFGGGGHSKAILEASSPNGRVIAIDRDPNTRSIANQVKDRYGSRFSHSVMSYDQTDRLETRFDGIVLDLGLSSDQLENSGRGFSFARNELLDMRFDARKGQTASQLLGQASPVELEKIFRQYGEDRHGGQLARKITSRRRSQPIRTTFDLVSVIGTTQPKVLSKIFQALRIAVNDELNRLTQGLEAVTSSLKQNGVLVVISFHSLEDRIVKNFIRNHLEPMTKKPILAKEREIINNSRSRSAKLRAGRKK